MSALFLVEMKNEFEAKFVATCDNFRLAVSDNGDNATVTIFNGVNRSSAYEVRPNVGCWKEVKIQHISGLGTPIEFIVPIPGESA